MERTLARNWWLVALRGAFALLFALLAYLWSGASARAVAVVMGIFLVVEGGLAASTAIGAESAEERAHMPMVEGVLGIALGLVLLGFVHQGTTAVRLVAAWIAAIGLLEASAAPRYTDHLVTPRLVIWLGVVSVPLAFALWILVPPMIVSLWLIAAWATFLGLTIGIVGLNLRRDVTIDEVNLLWRLPKD